MASEYLKDTSVQLREVYVPFSALFRLSYIYLPWIAGRSGLVCHWAFVFRVWKDAFVTQGVVIVLRVEIGDHRAQELNHGPWVKSVRVWVITTPDLQASPWPDAVTCDVSASDCDSRFMGWWSILVLLDCNWN